MSLILTDAASTKLIRLVFILIILINLKGACQSQILVTLSNTPETVNPGGHFTLFFDVRSSSVLPDSLREEILLPERWNLLSVRKPERVPGQQTLRYFFVIGTPPECAAGDFSVYFKLSSGGIDQGSVSALVTIQEVRKIEVFVVSQPEFVKEGEELHVSYLLQNSGNTREVFTVKTSRGTIDNATDSLTLEPNAKLTLTVSQKIPVTENNAWQSSSDITVQLKGNEPSVYQVVSVPVFSSTVKKIDRYFRFPVEVGGGYLSYQYGSRNMSAYQFSATGRGFVDQKEKHFVDFTIRGPNQFVFPAIGSYDQYSLDYQYRKKTLVSIGDYTLQLNNLMEFGRFGRGFRLQQQFKKVGYTLFYQKARFYFNQKESVGGKFTLKLSEAANLALSYDSKNIIYHDRQFWSHLLGVSGMIRTRDVQLETELAGGNARGKTDYAGFIRFQLVKNWITFSGNMIYAGKNFFGYYNNSILLNGNVGFNITRKVTLGISGNLSNLNPSLDANVYSVSPKDRSYMAFISYQPNVKNRFFVFYSIQEREDRQKPSEFHYSESFGNVSYTLSTEKFSLFYQGRYGYAQNELIFDNTGKKEQYSNLMQPAVRIFPWIWLGGYLEHQHTNKFSRSDVIENLIFYGGNLRITVKRNLFASFMYRNNYAPDELYERRSFMDASILWETKRHRVTLSGGRSFIPNIPGSNQNTLFFSLRYALKLNIPLSKKRNIGSVKGKLTGFGFPMQGTLIQLGSHKFLTDSTGAFAFEGLPPDKYYLSIAQNESRNEGVVPNLKMPMFVDVKADSLKIIEIPLTRTGNIAGKVEFAKVTQNGLSTILGQRPTVLIKLVNETESLLTELNDKDEFAFKEMKPGNWTLYALMPGNQDRFVIEEAEKQLSIEADKTSDVVFKIKPNEKRIHFSGKSFNLSIKK